MTTNLTTLLQELADKRGEFLAFVERRVGDRALAEDIVQDAYAKSSERLSDLRTPEAATAWFYRVLRNASVETYRRTSRRARAMDRVTVEAELAPREPMIDAVDSGCRCVGELVDTLKPEYAEAIRRIEIDGLPVKEFAAELGITAGNAGVRVHRARNALAREVTDTCGACASRGCGDCTCGS
jgi:RNA polymerase sigma factor (sigma-70 family)